MRRTILLLTIAMTSMATGWAQTNNQTVRGVVLDAFTSSPLAGATVVIADTKPIIRVVVESSFL